MNPKYKHKFKEEILKIVAARIIELVEHSDWVNPMVVQEKKTKGEIRIYVDLLKLNHVCVHDPFPTSFSDEILDNARVQEAYSFTDGFSGYHKIRITQKDRKKTTFATKWGLFKYIVMPFGLKNAHAIFSRVVFVVFKEFIHKFLEVYFDNWKIFGLVTNHVSNLRMMQIPARNTKYH